MDEDQNKKMGGQGMGGQGMGDQDMGDQGMGEEEMGQKGGQTTGGGVGGLLNLQVLLGGMSFPATKEELVQEARSKGADEDLIKSLEGLPEGRTFNAVGEVSSMIGKKG